MRVRISRCVVELIQRAAQAAAPQEVCGLLFGDDEAIDTANVTANVAKDPFTHFEIDPAALFAALRAERRGGPKIVGYWHSHPSGDARPSETDAVMAAADGRVWVIVTATAIRAWRAGQAGLHGRFADMDLIVT